MRGLSEDSRLEGAVALAFEGQLGEELLLCGETGEELFLLRGVEMVHALEVSSELALQDGDLVEKVALLALQGFLRLLSCLVLEVLPLRSHPLDLSLQERHLLSQAFTLLLKGGILLLELGHL